MRVDPSALPAVTINLEHGDTDNDLCQVLPFQLFDEMTEPNLRYPGYGELEVNVSVLILPDNIETGWWDLASSRELRKKVNRARRMGYEFAPFAYNDYLDDIYEINISKTERQGRPMDRGYLTRPQPRDHQPAQPCPRHGIGHFGVFNDGKLYAYQRVLQIGEVALSRTILGHGDHLRDGIMFLLLFEVARWHQEHYRTAYCCYHLADSGSEGLQQFKQTMGYVGHVVRWELSRTSAAST
jgi:hypothetical protein